VNEVVIENEVADEEEREEAALHLNQLNENLVTNTFFRLRNEFSLDLWKEEELDRQVTELRLRQRWRSEAVKPTEEVKGKFILLPRFDPKK